MEENTNTEASVDTNTSDNFEKHFANYDDGSSEVEEVETTEEKNDEVKEPETVQELKEEIVDENTTEEKVEQTTTPKILPPAQFSKEEKEAFSKLPADQQATVSKMAYNMRSELSRQSQEFQQLRPVLEAVKESANEYARKGISPADLVKRSIAWDKYISTNPIDGAREFLANYGIDPLDLVGEENNYSENQPQYNIDQLVEQKLQSKMQEQQNLQYAQQANAEVQQFVSENELFNDPNTANRLEEAMSSYVATIKVNEPSATPMQILKKAYNIVVNDDNLPFKALLSQINNREKAVESKELAEKASHASKSISGGMRSPTRSTKNIKGDAIFDHHFKNIKY